MAVRRNLRHTHVPTTQPEDNDPWFSNVPEHNNLTPARRDDTPPPPDRPPSGGLAIGILAILAAVLLIGK